MESSVKMQISHIAVFKNNSARPTKQGDLHSFFYADSENQVFDTHFSVRKNFFGHTAPSFGQIFILTKYVRKLFKKFLIFTLAKFKHRAKCRPSFIAKVKKHPSFAFFQ